MKIYRQRLFAALLLLVGSRASSTAQTPSGWLIHDLDRPRPAVVQPAAQLLPAGPPADAVVLFDGTDLRQWRAADGSPASWVVRDGYMESVPESGYVYSAAGFGDVQLHIEWAAPTPPSGQSQARGNSGVFLMGKYEVQVLDSYANDTYPDGQAAAIYGQYPPLVNACLPPGEWQAYDIVFRRPRFDEQGALLSPARVTMLHNGILVHDARALWGPTSWLQHFPYRSHGDRLPLALQDHGNPVRYRNIWLRELPETSSPGPQKSIARPYYPLPADAFERFVGSYVMEDDTPVEISQGESRLWAQPFGRERLELAPRSATEFFLRWTAGRIVFQVDQEQRATGLELHLGGRTYAARRVVEPAMIGD